MRTSLPVLLAFVLAVAALPAGGAVASAGPSGSEQTATISKRRRRVCDRNYRGRCLRPNVRDYDCAGGSGNGPYYVRGPFTVVGNDHYRLDSDGDGIACESR